MNDTTAALAILVGLIARLAVPIGITALAVLALRHLDARWQAEAMIVPPKVEKPRCWKAMTCPPSKRKVCRGYKSTLPCWQVFRLPTGYLSEKCIGCKVFAEAPLPART
jgi:hypothetical protein